MIWTIVVILLFSVLILYVVGSFIPHSTNMCVIDVERGVNDSFAMANQPDNYARLSKIGKPTFTKGSFTEKESSGQLEINGKVFDFEITEFIPNYRMAAQHINSSEQWLVQLSFYRLSLNSCRIVLIVKVSASSNWQRLSHAFNKKKREQWINARLSETKNLLESAENVPEHFEDVSAEENPNFSLR